MTILRSQARHAAAATGAASGAASGTPAGAAGGSDEKGHCPSQCNREVRAASVGKLPCSPERKR